MFIRNVNYGLLDSFVNKEGIAVVKSRDGTEIDWTANGVQIVKLF